MAGGASLLIQLLLDRPSPMPRIDFEPIKFKDSTLDPNNPPDEVREAAADMGFSVEVYKAVYLNRPSLCELLPDLYNGCVKYDPDNVSGCESYLKQKLDKYQCPKFMEKYSGQWLKY